MNGLTISPTRSTNCSTRPLTPARTTVFSSSTSAWASAASALAFCGREQRRDPRLGGLFCSRGGSDRTHAALHKNLELLDFAERDVTRIAPLQFLLGLQFVHGLLVQRSWPPESGLQPSGYRLAPPPFLPRSRQSCAAQSPTAASCFELSSLKIGAPLAIGPLMPT